ncbi:MAG: SPOR domain-containing protein [Desulfuromonadales bacterium]|nr:SPOR domain-containing protein [Desulfuromonadales bacterium]
MDIKFSKDSAGNQQDAADSKGKQNALLVLLLVLVGGFVYIYFFTGLIKPVKEEKTAEAPPPVSQVTKKALPAVDGAPAKADADGEVKKDAAAPAVKPLPAPAPPAAAPAPVAAAKPVSAAKPVVQEAAKVKEEPKLTAEAQPSVKKPLPAAGKADVKKPAPPEKKEPVAAENKAQPAKVDEKKPAEAKKPQAAKVDEKKPADVKKPAEKKAVAVPAVVTAKKEVQKPVKKEPADSGKVTGSGPWTVLVGNYVLEEALATDLARVRKAGLDAYVVPGVKKKSHMNRLLLADFTDRDSAQAELTKLKRYTSDAFMIDNAGMHSVYAGSYLLDARAGSEKERLAVAGFKLTVQRVDVSIPSKNLTAGSFAEKSAAEQALKKLRAADVKATLSHQ